MTTFLLVTFLIISIGLNVAAFILIRNLLSKIDTYEKWILEFKQNVIDTLTVMRELDTKGTFATSLNDKGTFEADDQVGQIFKDLLELIEILNDRTK
jgi:hypothetical protein